MCIRVVKINDCTVKGSVQGESDSVCIEVTHV